MADRGVFYVRITKAMGCHPLWKSCWRRSMLSRVASRALLAQMNHAVGHGKGPYAVANAVGVLLGALVVAQRVANGVVGRAWP